MIEFSTYPTMLSEYTGSMSPRDVLMKSLRDVDSKSLGFEPDTAMVILSDSEGAMAFVHTPVNRAMAIGSLSILINELAK